MAKPDELARCDATLRTTPQRIAIGKDPLQRYCPFHTGSRFSKKAFTPSSMSSVESASVS